MTVYYPPFTDEERTRVWTIFFDKLERDRADMMRVPIATKDYTDGKDVKALKWNGREIRNGKLTLSGGLQRMEGSFADHECDY